ncbi:MAG: hypothetical protein JNM84_04785 [Planctomycetes bacterium]|nr:hypothetical protein [Planctomycetota bacterium]
MRASLCLVALLATSDAHAQADLERLVQQLAGDDHAASLSAYRELFDRADPALVPLIQKDIVGWKRNAQHYGVLLLTQSTQNQPKGPTRAMWKKLSDAGPGFLRLAALVRLFDLEGERSTVAQLASELRALPENERAGVLYLLHGMNLEREEEVFAALLSWLHPDASGSTIVSVLHRLRSLAPRTAALRAAVEPLAQSEDPSARAAALAYLTGFEAKYAAELAALLQAEPVRLGPIRGLLDGERKLPAPLLEAIVATLPKATNEYEVRQTAELLRKQSPSAGVAELRELLGNAKPELRAAALEALGLLVGGLDEKLLQQLLRGNDLPAALVAADLLRRRDDPSGLEVVLAAQPQTLEHQVKHAEVLSRFRDRRVGPRLLDLLDHPDARVRTSAWNGLQQLMNGLFPYRRFDFATSGYAPNAAARQAGIATLRAWWDAQAKAR